MSDILTKSGESEDAYVRHTIPARRWSAITLNEGSSIKIFNTSGTQVIDTWAFNALELSEYMSMEHSRASLLKIVPGAGDTLVTNRRRAILTIVEDTTPGTHDTLIAACDRHRYEQLRALPHHDNCTDNLGSALASLGHPHNYTPCPFNLFMNVPLAADGTLDFAAPIASAGEYVCLRAEMPLLLIMSACPQDVTPVNGHAPSDAHYMFM